MDTISNTSPAPLAPEYASRRMVSKGGAIIKIHRTKFTRHIKAIERVTCTASDTNVPPPTIK